MAGDEDLARHLPDPPQPAPARRAAAIEAAMRRFDGSEAAPQPPTVRASWPAPRRAFAGALISAALVAVIAGPIALHQMWRPAALDRGRQAPALGNGRQQAAAVAPAAQPDAANAVADVEPAPAPDPASPASPKPAEAPPARAAAEPSSASGLLAPRESPPPPAPPPAPPTQVADAIASSARASNKAARPAGEDRLALDERTRAPAAAPPVEMRAEEESGANIVVTGTRIRAPGRGDWNACTVEDPRRSLAACRKRVDGAAKGPAAAQLAEGLDRAWQGDTEEAIAAFDRAVAAAPKSAFAYLNRGLAWRRRGDLARALADLDRAVKYAPGDARAYYSRSLVLRAQGANARARRDEERAVALDPDYADVVP